jgi:hypothetical protein
VVQVALREPLEKRRDFSFETVDVTAYPYASPALPAPCHRAVRSHGPDAAEHILDAAGEERLRLKSRRMATAVHEKGAEQVLYEEVLCALGYKRNRVPFRELARRIPLETLRSEAAGDVTCGYALLAGVAGLLPGRPSPRWDRAARAFVRQLWDHWWKQQAHWDSHRLPRDAWQLSGIRPQNHPLRRLMAAALLFIGPETLFARLRSVPVQDPPQWVRRVARSLQPPCGHGFWARRLSLSGKPRRQPVALVGTGRAASMVTNIAAPFLSATGAPDAVGAALLRCLPAEPSHGTIRQMAHVLLGRDHNPALYRSGLRQQGLIQIFNDFCLNNRSACAECPLPAAIRQSFGSGTSAAAGQDP